MKTDMVTVLVNIFRKHYQKIAVFKSFPKIYNTALIFEIFPGHTKFQGFVDGKVSIDVFENITFGNSLSIAF